MALTDQLRAAYKLSDTSDYSGNGYNLTNTGSVTFGSGLIGNCAQFGSPNTTKYLSYIGSMGISSGDDWTLSFWFRTPANNLIGAAMELTYGGGTRQMDFIWDGAGGVSWDIFPTGGSNMMVAGTVANNIWYSVMLVCSSGTITCYINNVSIGTASIGSTSGKTDGLGTYGAGIAWFQNGDLDLMYLWNRAITSGERSQMYNGGSGYEIPIGGNSNMFLMF
jgi:hypothetical protein